MRYWRKALQRSRFRARSEDPDLSAARPLWAAHRRAGFRLGVGLAASVVFLTAGLSLAGMSAGAVTGTSTTSAIGRGIYDGPGTTPVVGALPSGPTNIQGHGTYDAPVTSTTTTPVPTSTPTGTTTIPVPTSTTSGVCPATSCGVQIPSVPTLLAGTPLAQTPCDFSATGDYPHISTFKLLKKPISEIPFGELSAHGAWVNGPESPLT
jgi:hypothetical protein